MKRNSIRAKPKSFAARVIQIQLPEDPIELVKRMALAFIVGMFFWQHSNGDWITMLFPALLTLSMKSDK